VIILQIYQADFLADTQICVHLIDILIQQNKTFFPVVLG
jgi:hypothetical protein